MSRAPAFVDVHFLKHELGQLFIEIFLKPWNEYMKLKSTVAYSLVLYANLYGNPMSFHDAVGGDMPLESKEEYRNAGKELRILDSKLMGFNNKKLSVNFYLPKDEQIAKASKALIGLSNSMNTCSHYPEVFVEQNRVRVEIIKESLKIN